MSSRNDVRSVVQLNKIRRKLDSDRFRFEDFESVCPYTMDEITSPSRKSDLVTWRHVAMAWTVLCEKSLSEAGRTFNRSHCTVIHSLGVVADSLEGFGIPEVRSAVLKVCANTKNQIQVAIPFDEYHALLAKHFGQSKQVETIAKDTYGYLPKVLL